MTEKQRKRENFSQEEKMLIVQFVKDNHIIMEDKSGNVKIQIAKKRQMEGIGSANESKVLTESGLN